MADVQIIDNRENKSRGGRRWLWMLITILLVISIGVSGFVVWAINPTVEIDPIAYDALEDSDNITVTDRAWLAFLPHTPPETGIILYPGGRVPATAYAPLAREIAENGYLVVIAYPPINLAILNQNLATPIMAHFSGVEKWVIGGHSLGGSVAASYAVDHPEIIRGVVLMAARPADDGLVGSDIQVTSIYGTNDGLSTLDEVNEARANLPVDTSFVAIEGGNHAQFGYYGEQSGDNPATITRDEQISQTVAAILQLLEQVDRQN